MWNQDPRARESGLCKRLTFTELHVVNRAYNQSTSVSPQDKKLCFWHGGESSELGGEKPGVGFGNC